MRNATRLKGRRWVWGGLLVALAALPVGCGSETEGTASTASGGGRGGEGGGEGGGDGGSPTGSSTASTGVGGAGGEAGAGGGGGAGGGAGGAGGEAGAGGGGGAGGGAGGMGGSGQGGAGGAGQGGAGGGGGAQACQTNADCDDNVFCNGVETCDAGTCAMGAPPSCDDGVACSVDVCDSITDACANAPNNAACDNGLFCDGIEACDLVLGGCAPSAGSPCDDGVGCTADACDEAADSCSHAPDNAACDNQVKCDGTEVCNALFGCLSSNPLSCDDGVACTSDFCDLAADACAHVNDDTACQNGMFCDGVEKCDPANGAPQTGCVPGQAVNCGDNIACTQDACNEATDACDHTPNNAACGDGVHCDGAEVCVVGVGCQDGPPVVCDDNRSCTQDMCSEAVQGCVFAPNDAACNNNLDCDGVEVCDPAAPGPTGCAAGIPIPCPSDNVACTVDACNESTNACEHTPTNSLCAAGQFCIPGQGNSGCTPAPPCATAADCDDGNACNGVETCNGVCQPGQPVNCDDNVGCTDDSCNPATGACSYVPTDSFCSDGLACNGNEVCNAQQGCLPGVAVNCGDGVACTADSCQEPSGSCTHTKLNFLCSDNSVCNGVETCTDSGCMPGQPFLCPDDGIACTTSVCDPVANACVTTTNDSVCPCGQTCNPAQGGCGSFCQVSTCQGKTYTCGDCIDNDGDCSIDSADTQCLGPCDNTENSFYGGISGQNNSPCKSDCYFDQDTGSGNDDCFWSHKCDPLEVAPNYPPEGSQCAYSPSSNIPGYNGTCATAFSTQSAQCLSYCGPLTPNGCDCFGCCVIPGAPTTVWLGSENPAGTGSCNINTVNDPTKCKPCTQVQACLNSCENCEVCIGKPTLPPECTQQQCPAGKTPCGLPGQAPCPFGNTCITGCCVPNP
ncbi:MAG TPA: hypothetical protein VE093_29175 [Polyangiaceae bacterium]|nr:hypothetical protein [Polyangiaceae bacterium]